jgi:hypothetical protein
LLLSLDQAKRRAAGYALSLKTLDLERAAEKRHEEAVAKAASAAAAAKAAALHAAKDAASVPHSPPAPSMPQAQPNHPMRPSWHLVNSGSPISRVETAEAAATAARAAVVAAESQAAAEAKAVAIAEQHLVEADHAAEEAQASAAANLAKQYEKKVSTKSEAILQALLFLVFDCCLTLGSCWRAPIPVLLARSMTQRGLSLPSTVKHRRSQSCNVLKTLYRRY